MLKTVCITEKTTLVMPVASRFLATMITTARIATFITARPIPLKTNSKQDPAKAGSYYILNTKCSEYKFHHIVFIANIIKSGHGIFKRR